MDVEKNFEFESVEQILKEGGFDLDSLNEEIKKTCNELQESYRKECVPYLKALERWDFDLYHEFEEKE